MEASILLWIQEHMRTPALTGFMSFITSLGNSGWFWLVLSLLLLIAALMQQAKIRNPMNSGNHVNPFMRPALTCLLSMLLCFLIVNLFLKNAVARVRPYDRIPELVLLARKPKDFSFPSGHTAFSFASATALYLTGGEKNRPVTLFLLALAALIGFSRLYLGVHYPTDVIAGAFLGWICGKTAELFIRKHCHSSESHK
ncbi:MAG: phosphatase PAP2 family protein [Lachnospiraceae bacterium]|nr:phosphatase PAP2 family protein [Lachnospiraceae bacterium]